MLPGANSLNCASPASLRSCRLLHLEKSGRPASTSAQSFAVGCSHERSSSVDILPSCRRRKGDCFSRPDRFNQVRDETTGASLPRLLDECPKRRERLGTRHGVVLSPAGRALPPASLVAELAFGAVRAKYNDRRRLIISPHRPPVGRSEIARPTAFRALERALNLDRVWHGWDATRQDCSCLVLFRPLPKEPRPPRHDLGRRARRAGTNREASRVSDAVDRAQTKAQDSPPYSVNVIERQARWAGAQSAFAGQSQDSAEVHRQVQGRNSPSGG
jgi:hypothetical protein